MYIINLFLTPFFYCLVQEFEIIDHFLGPQLKDEVLKIMPVQKQTRAGQRTRFKVNKPFSLRVIFTSISHVICSCSSFMSDPLSGSLCVLSLQTYNTSWSLCLMYNFIYSTPALPFLFVYFVSMKINLAIIAGFCGYWRLQRTHWSGCEVQQGSGHCNPWSHHPGQAVHCPCEARILG